MCIINFIKDTYSMCIGNMNTTKIMMSDGIGFVGLPGDVTTTHRAAALTRIWQ